MTPNTFEIVTVLTAVSFGTILLLYFIVLKRKGWLSEDSHGSSYRCPNPLCRRIFQKPTVLTDLSETPACVHPACPHCGFDLEGVAPLQDQKKFKMAVEVPPSPKKRLEEPMVSVRTPEPAKSVELKEFQEKPTIAGETQESSEVPSEQIEAPRITTTSKRMEARPSTCPRFFGYLKNIPKNVSIPDECFRCPKMVECLYHNPSE